MLGGAPRPLDVGGRMVGPGHPCLLIAEAGVNHNGDLDLARRLVDAAARAGADAVKFQTFSAERLAVPGARKAAYQLRGSPEREGQLEMLRRLELDERAHRDLLERCRRRGILFLSAPFDEGSADMLERLGVPAYKIPSGELTNLPFLAYVASKGKPMIVSTGMSSLREVRDAARALRGAGCREWALLHCVSKYPAKPGEANLRAMGALSGTFRVPVGYSDHTPGIEVALAAAALGACVIEKHLTLDRASPGPDHAASLEPGEFRELARGLRVVESSLGDGRKRPAPGEGATALAARKSLVAARDIPAGSRLTRELVGAMRPGTGLPPSMLRRVLGRAARRDIPRGRLLSLGMLR